MLPSSIDVLTSFDVFSIYLRFLHLSLFSPFIYVFPQLLMLPTSNDIFSIYRFFHHLSIFYLSTDVIYIYRYVLLLSTSVDIFSTIDVFSIYRCFSTCRCFLYFPSFTKYFLHIHTIVLLSPTFPLSSSIFSSIFLGLVRWSCSFDLPMICLYIDYFLNVF